MHDLLGMNTGRVASFVKQYKNITQDVLEGVERYISEVRDGIYPDEEHSFKG